MPRVVGPIRRRQPVEVRDLESAARQYRPPIKATVPGPFTMGKQAQDDFYGDEEAVAMDYAAAVNAEIKDLFAAGADVVQIDEPWMQQHPDKARHYGLKALDRALDGVTGTVAVHLCFGYAAVVHDKPSGYSFLPGAGKEAWLPAGTPANSGWPWPQAFEAVPAHMRDLEAGPGRDRHDLARDPAEARRWSRYSRPRVGHQLHADADAEERLAALDHRRAAGPRPCPARAVEAGAAVGEGADARQHDAVGRGDLARVGGDERRARPAPLSRAARSKRLGGRAQIARAVIDDRGRSSQAMRCRRARPWSMGTGVGLARIDLDRLAQRARQRP